MSFIQTKKTFSDLSLVILFTSAPTVCLLFRIFIFVMYFDNQNIVFVKKLSIFSVTYYCLILCTMHSFTIKNVIIVNFRVKRRMNINPNRKKLFYVILMLLFFA